MRGGSGIRDGPPVSPVETDMMVLQEDLRLSSDSEVGWDVSGDELSGGGGSASEPPPRDPTSGDG